MQKELTESSQGLDHWNSSQPGQRPSGDAGRFVSRAVVADPKVIEVDFENDPRYELFLASHPDAQIFHHPSWLRVLKQESRTKSFVLACENAAGEFEAVLPMMYTRGLPFNIGTQQTGRRLSSLPRTPAAGLVSANPDATVMLLRSVLDVTRVEGVQLQIKSHSELPAQEIEGLLHTVWRPTYVLAIPERREDLRFGDARNRHNLKWAVKKAEKKGLRIRPAESEAELRAWHRLYLETMRRNVVPPRPLRLFLAMWKELSPQGLMHLQLAEHVDGDQRRLVAGSIFLQFGQTIWYAFTGVADRDLSLHPNDLILWHAIHAACGTGVLWMDFGEVSEEHPELVRFKTKWGAQPKPQYRYYSGGTALESGAPAKVDTHTTGLFRRWWRRLPLQVTAQLGGLIYSRL